MEVRLDPRSKRWPRSAMLASTLPGLIACSDRSIDTGFRVTNVAFDNESTITLTFSQSVSDPGAVDPNDFRLSMGQTMRVTYTYDGVTETYEYTSYRDLSTIVYDYSNYGMPFGLMVVEPGAAANQIVLRTTIPLGPDACDWIDYVRDQFEMYVMNYAEAGSVLDLTMFLHYAAGDIPIESEAGEPLADIGRDWVLNPDQSYEREGFGFTKLSPQLRIPCP